MHIGQANLAAGANLQPHGVRISWDLANKNGAYKPTIVVISWEYHQICTTDTLILNYRVFIHPRTPSSPQSPAGACLALGLRFAGSSNEAVKELLIARSENHHSFAAHQIASIATPEKDAQKCYKKDGSSMFFPSYFPGVQLLLASLGLVTVVKHEHCISRKVAGLQRCRSLGCARGIDGLQTHARWGRAKP